MTPWAALITGLTTGGLTCLAVQGGLLASLLAQRGVHETERGFRRFAVPVGAFLAAKLIIYTVAGFGLGWLGDRIQLSDFWLVTFQILAALFMVAAGIRLVKPGFMPWLAINPPASLRRFIRQRAKSDAVAAPLFLGLLTIFLPCGTTQAMELAAISSGSPFQGAAILFAFVLGTMPLFFIIGVLAKGAAFTQRKLAWATALIVIGLGLYSFNSALVYVGSPYSFQNQVKVWQWAMRGGGATVTSAAGPAATEQTIDVSGGGYEPSDIVVAAGKPVTLNLRSNGPLGCASIFRIPSIGIRKVLPESGLTTINATFAKPGTYTFSCGMGMYSGTIQAI